MLIQTLLEQKNLIKLQQAVRDFFQETPQKQDLWTRFCTDLNLVTSYRSVKLDQTEMWWLCRAGLLCLNQSTDGAAYLAQFKSLALYLKERYGATSLRIVFGHVLSPEEYQFEAFAKACHYLLDLFDSPDVFSEFSAYMPRLSEGVQYLRETHNAYLLSRFPTRDLDSVIERFKQDSMVTFPLAAALLETLKSEYKSIQDQLKPLQQCSLEELKSNISTAKTNDSLIAHIIELIRRFYGIYPHDTQLLSFLALSRQPSEELKGYVGQIKAGEGKSLIIAMLAGFLGCQGKFVDVITSADYLAIRDCQKYQPFFAALGLTVSHICHSEPIPVHFQGQILYGTNTDFEFATLRDGLYSSGLRNSYLHGVLVPRTYDVCINDEIDSLFLDMAFNSALLSIERDENLSSLYVPIYQFVEKLDFKKITLDKAVQALAKHLGELVTTFALSETRLKHYLLSAKRAMSVCEQGKDYVIKPVRTFTEQGYQEIESIVIVDYVNTGRASEGSQWQHGLHQFLQVKHQLKITAESLTAASLAHPTYFNFYDHIIGLTGTMGLDVERREIKDIYKVETFDVPPFVPSQFKELPSLLTNSESAQFQTILSVYSDMKAAGRPVLVLFETIQATEMFFKFVQQKKYKAQILNTHQRESEDYIIAKAGESGALTIATNVAGRGTDILLSPESLEAGGLDVIYGFYPDNIRVREQGFRRSGRQGQPGSGQMILNLQEDRIQQLLKTNPLSRCLLGKTLQDLSASGRLAIEGDIFVQHLEELQTESIKAHSKARAQAARQEAIFFEKLKGFFKGLETINHYFKSASGIDAFITACKQFSLPQTPIAKAYMLLDKSDLERLISAAQPILEKQSQGISMDWQGFLNQFKTLSLTAIKKRWSQFYNQLHDEIGYGETSAVKNAVDKAYEAAKERFEPFLVQPESAFLEVLTRILSIAAKITENKQQGIADSVNNYFDNPSAVDREKISIKETRLIESFNQMKGVKKNVAASTSGTFSLSTNPLSLYKEALTHYKAKSYESSIKSLQSAIIGFQEKTDDSSLEKIATCYSTLASAYRDKGDYELALNAAEKAFICLEELKKDTKAISIKYSACLTFSNNTAEDIYKLAIENYKKQHYSLALCQLNYCLNQWQKDHKNLATCYSTMASCQRELGLFDEALDFCNAALKCCEQSQRRAIETKREGLLKVVGKQTELATCI